MSSYFGVPENMMFQTAMCKKRPHHFFSRLPVKLSFRTQKVSDLSLFTEELCFVSTFLISCAVSINLPLQATLMTSRNGNSSLFRISCSIIQNNERCDETTLHCIRWAYCPLIVPPYNSCTI